MADANFQNNKDRKTENHTWKQFGKRSIEAIVMYVWHNDVINKGRKLIFLRNLFSAGNWKLEFEPVGTP